MPRKAPQRPGEALRGALLDRYDLDPHELVLLDSAARTADLIADLQAVIDRDGPMVDGKPNPAAVEARLQRITWPAAGRSAYPGRVGQVTRAGTRSAWLLEAKGGLVRFRRPPPPPEMPARRVCSIPPSGAPLPTPPTTSCGRPETGRPPCGSNGVAHTTSLRSRWCWNDAGTNGSSAAMTAAQVIDG